MSQTQIQVISRCDVTNTCSAVTLCLGSEWAERTLSGVPLITATIVAINKVMLPSSQVGCYTQIVPSGPCCNVGGNVYPSVPAAKNYNVPACAYTLNIELDTQFAINPDTGLPFTPVSTDIQEIIPYVCFPNTLINSFIVNQIDCTLKRTEEGVIGVNDFPEPPEGASSLFGFDNSDPRCGVRIFPVRARAIVSSGSSSLGDFASLTNRLIDFDEVTDEEGIGQIVTGSGWTFTALVAGTYLVEASLRFANSLWGHSGLSDYASILLFSKKNADALKEFAVNYAPGVDDVTFSAAPWVQGTDFFRLVVGDTLKFYAQHTDTDVDAHGMIASNLSRISIERVF